jgi:hypothetical protein
MAESRWGWDTGRWRAIRDRGASRAGISTSTGAALDVPDVDTVIVENADLKVGAKSVSRQPRSPRGPSRTQLATPAAGLAAPADLEMVLLGETLKKTLSAAEWMQEGTGILVGDPLSRVSS